MATIKASSLFCSSLPQRIIKASGMKAQTRQTQSSNFSLPSNLQVNDLLDELKMHHNGMHHSMLSTSKMIRTKLMKEESTTNSNVVAEMYAIMEAVADRVEMHKNIGEQRNNWNQLLLSSVNGMVTTAATMAGIAAMNGAGESLLALKLSSTLLYVSATGILMIMNKIQPSQLAEEQRNALRLFKQLHEEFKTTIALKNVTSMDVETAMEKVLALDKAYPLPLLGAMLDKFPKRVEPATWWPKHEESDHYFKPAAKLAENGWNEKLEDEMRKVVGWIKRKDEEDYVKLAKMALKINKILAISGPLLTGLAAAGSALMGLSIASINVTPWPTLLAVVCGALATVVNTIEHGGQVGMVFEMYRSSAGFFRLMEENIGSVLKEDEAVRRENGEVFEAKVALGLGRSPSELRELASAASSASRNPNSKDEFACKLF